jgi:hypothetical protein
MSRTLKVRGGIISQVHRYLGGFYSSQRIFLPQTIQVLLMAVSFKGAHFPQDIILMGVRWYVAYPLSTRHVEELMLERGVHVDHSTINRWVVKYSLQLLTWLTHCVDMQSWKSPWYGVRTRKAIHLNIVGGLPLSSAIQ